MIDFFIFFYIDRSFVHYIVLTYFSKLCEAEMFNTVHFAYSLFFKPF